MLKLSLQSWISYCLSWRSPSDISGFFSSKFTIIALSLFWSASKFLIVDVISSSIAVQIHIDILGNLLILSLDLKPYVLRISCLVCSFYCFAFFSLAICFLTTLSKSIVRDLTSYSTKSDWNEVTNTFSVGILAEWLICFLESFKSKF